ncbi:hypothetical protein GIB67_019700 [Kingdonia uniflora]|uniref:histidine kinase n=1 Tax=Kingdonia uniflora TaxID=39325 RepID=A0A7J7MK52_9MAGN|nr:hypothetical protein GIB67_019700 [Kingdonia uniflora]
MDSCNCIEPQWPADELLMKYQYNSDFFIALAYYSIPLELIYFVKRSAVFPYRWVLVQFGVFIVLCGATHLINLWTFNMHSRTMVIVLTMANVLTAVVSQTILKTTLAELRRALTLEECALWMPTRIGLELQLSYILWHQNPVGFTISIQLPVINQVFSSNRAVKISPNSPVVRLRPLVGKYIPGEVADTLSHAAILKESMRARDHLAEQNVALDLARREPEIAIRARNDFLAVMNHEMRTPMHAIIALYSLLQETELTAEQRLMVETVLKSTLDLPEYVVGDEQLLMQTILNVAGNAVKFSKEGSISVSVSVAKLESLRDSRAPSFSPMPSDNHFYLRVQVKDSGSGISPQDILKLFNKFADSQSLASKNSCGKGLGLLILKRFLSLMEGHIWIESEGLGKGCTATFFVKPGIAVRPKMATKGLLVHLGCDITAVGSSEESLRIFSHEHKVVFTDAGISGMDGYEVVSVLQDRFSARHQRPLITASTDRATKDNCLRVGMDGVVLKPVSLEKMRSVLSVLLQNGTTRKMRAVDCSRKLQNDLKILLNGEADPWWDTSKMTIIETPVLWASFQDRFFKQYFPQSYMDACISEFYMLVQGDMNITKYDQRFKELSRYVPFIVQDEEQRKMNILKSLCPYFRKFLISSGASSYSEVLSKALAIEQNDIEDRRSKDLRSQVRQD